MKTENINGPDSATIQKMFSSIAGRYDRANTVLSAGIHHLWRKQLVNWCDIPDNPKILDCATGTGDLALEWARLAGPKGQVIGTDFCDEMLIPAPQKAYKAGYDIEFQTADVTRLPFADNQFDISSISFGIRNVEDPTKGVQELARVVRSEGTVMILEFGQPSSALFSSLYNWYSKSLLPSIGGLVTGDRKAYQYLQDSSSQFPCGEDFVSFMWSSGLFSNVSYKTLTGGIAYIYKATVR